MLQDTPLSLSVPHPSSLAFLLFSCSVMSDSLQPDGPQHARLPCPSLSPGVGSNSCPLSQLRHPAISSSVAPLPCFQPFPASGSFLMSRLFASGGQSIGASASVLPMNIQGWFPLGLTGLILQSSGLWGVFSSTTIQKHQFFSAWPSLWSSSHIRMWSRRVLTGQMRPLSIRPTANKNYREASNLD